MEQKTKCHTGETCANCDILFGEILHEANSELWNSNSNQSKQVTDFLVSVSDCEKTVTLFEALNSVFTLNPNKVFRDQKFVEKNEYTFNGAVVMCHKCAQIVSNLYKSYVELMELSKATSLLARVLRQAHSWHLRHGSYLREESSSSKEKNLIDQNKFDNEEVCEDDDYDYDEFDNGINSVLSVNFSEGEPDNLSSTIDKSGQQQQPNIKTVPKKRKILDVGTELGDFSESSLKSSRRKNSNPLRTLSTVSSSEISINVRRSQRVSKTVSEAQYNVSPPIKKKRRLKKVCGTIRHRRLKRRTQLAHGLLQIPTETDNEIEVGHSQWNDIPRPYKKPHRKVPYMPPQLPCGKCNKLFHCQWMVDHHVLLVHQKRKPKNCKVCNLKYFDEDVFKTHICIPISLQGSEKKIKPYRCKYCGKTLRNRGNLTRHCAAHDSDTVLTCPHPNCKLTFKIAENLIKHGKVHFEEQPIYQCQICGKVFKVKRRLVDHMDIHLDEKKYLCTQCGVRFAQQKALVRHSRVHETLLRYQCPLCEKKFKRRDNVTQHLNSKIHPKEQVETIRSLGITAVDTAKKSTNTSALNISENINKPSTSLPSLPGKIEFIKEEPSSQNFPFIIQSVESVSPVSDLQANFSCQPNELLNHHPTEFQYSELLHL